MISGITKQGLIYIEKKDITKAVNIVLGLQNNADMLTEDSSDAELRDAYHNHGIAHGYIRCLRDLGLLSEPDYSKLFIEQIRISEMISNLQGNRLKEVSMKGIVRRIDDLGRITLPMEYRRSFGIGAREDAPIGIYVNKNIIRLHMKKEKFVGMVRNLDELGRLTLPKEIRKSLKFDDHELVDMWIDNEEICIRKATLQCVICGSDDEGQLMDVDGVLICRSCGTKVIDKFMED